MLQRYKRAHTLTLLWFSSINLVYSITGSAHLIAVRFNIGHLKENELFPEHAIISAEVSGAAPQASVYYHVIRRVEKYTFSTYADNSFFRWHLLECFINEFLPEMDTYRESKVRQMGQDLTYRKRGRCLEFVRIASLKTIRSTTRRDPYPFSMRLRFSPTTKLPIKYTENYLRMFRLPIRVYKKINRWWLAKKYWEW